MYALVRLSGVGFCRSIESRIFLFQILKITPGPIKINDSLEEIRARVIEDDTSNGQTEI